MNQLDARKYNISVRFGEFEGEACYEATIKELPTIAEYADTYAEAYALAIDTIETLAQLYAEQGKQFPQPAITPSSYSGRITLRLPKSLHYSVAQMAEAEEVSLNSLITSALSAFVGFGAGLKQTTDNWHDLEKPMKVNVSKAVPEVIYFQEYQQAANG